MENLFSINRSLCEIEYNKYLKDMDVNIVEYVWFKIRESYLTKQYTESFTIEYTELTKHIGKYHHQNKPISDSIQRLGELKLTTNVKSNEDIKKYTFKFEVSNGKGRKRFTVEVNPKIYRLFDKPKMYNEYNQNNVYNLNTKYSKLFYKFIIGYRYLKQKSFFVTSDVLRQILNIDTDKNDSYVKSNFINKSIKEISEKTDINVSIKKDGYEYKGDIRIVKYKVTIDEYRGCDMKIDLRQRKKSNKSESQQWVDNWINHKKNYMMSDEEYVKSKGISSMKIPMLFIENSITHLPLYIDNEYRITNSSDVYTENSDETQSLIQQWEGNHTLSITVKSVNGVIGMEKMCLLSKQQLRNGGYI